jgi:hypothetical protein
MSIFSKVDAYTRLISDLRKFLRENISLEQSKRELSIRLQEREANLLNLMWQAIYANPKSPYFKLLRISACEFGDIEALVKKDGIEGMLSKLLADGVYLSWEEFKGKKDVVRGSSRFRLRDTDLDNPFLTAYYYGRSGRSRGTGTRIMFDLNHQLDIAYYDLLTLAAHNALDVPIGLWMSMLPSTAGINSILRQWVMGKPITKWFTPVTENQVRSDLGSRLFSRYVIYGGRLYGAKLAKPEYVSLAEAVKVAEWMAATKREFKGCSLKTFVSPGVKVCQSAVENGIDIEQTRLFVSGEPLSPVIKQQIEAAGVIVIPRYYITEVGYIGCGCPHAGASDDMHIFSDSVAVIQHKRKVEHSDIHVNAFLYTSLLASSPKILLNVESDDYGIIETRNCGCFFEELGFKDHIHNIRSFAKLTGSGMTIMGSDFIRILEVVLPHKYGGTAPDYQLVEEDSEGRTFLSLIISPEVGKLDEADVINTVLRELRKNVSAGNLAAGFWSQVNTLRVKREYPFSSCGKVLPLHLVNSI